VDRADEISWIEKRHHRWPTPHPKVEDILYNILIFQFIMVLNIVSAATAVETMRLWLVTLTRASFSAGIPAPFLIVATCCMVIVTR
jgi:hypothetical protein